MTGSRMVMVLLALMSGCLTAQESVSLRIIWEQPDWEAQQPSARSGMSLLFDQRRDRILLFGGIAHHQRFADCWAFATDTRRWQRLNVGPGPSARFAHAVAYDARRERMWLFGGEDASGLRADLWYLDLRTDRWQQVVAAAGTPAPAARRGHALAYDAQRDELLLFGGVEDATELRMHDELWRFDLDAAQWQRLSVARGQQPAGRMDFAASYDARHGRWYVHGGVLAPQQRPDGCMWRWDRTTQQWSRIGLDNHLCGGAMLRMRDDRLFHFGGNDSAVSAWWQPGERHFTIAPDAAAPEARSGHAMVIDRAREVCYCFGGSLDGPAGRPVSAGMWVGQLVGSAPRLAQRDSGLFPSEGQGRIDAVASERQHQHAIQAEGDTSAVR